MAKLFLIMGSFLALLSVGLGAFGAHAWKERLGSYISTYETGIQYHMMHAIGLLIIALALEKLGGSMLAVWAGWLLCIGILLFSGSLYALSLSGVKWLGAITPLGGVAFIVGWFLFALAAFQSFKS